MVPVSGEYEVVRIFFDSSLSDEELVSAIIFTGSYMIESKGISYAKSDNSVFDVCSIYDGKVTSVEEDELNGVCVTIQHADDVVSIYSSLSNVNVKVNDTVKVGQVIGKASTSLIRGMSISGVNADTCLITAYISSINCVFPLLLFPTKTVKLLTFTLAELIFPKFLTLIYTCISAPRFLSYVIRTKLLFQLLLSSQIHYIYNLFINQFIYTRRFNR